MTPLTLAIIARDEADRLPEAIRSVPFAAEVLVLDSGSRDGTPEVARALGARVIQTDWPGHVAQKNRALAEARHDWVLSLDADEALSPALQQSVAAALATDPGVDGFTVSRLSWWEGAPIRHGLWYPDRRIRLVRRAKARFVGLNPHDRLEVSGAVGALHGDLLHHPYRDLGEHLATLDRYTAAWCAAALADGRRARPWDVALRPPLHFVKAILFRAGFRDGVRGWCLAGLGATYVLLKWARLWLAQQGRGGAG